VKPVHDSAAQTGAFADRRQPPCPAVVRGLTHSALPAPEPGAAGEGSAGRVVEQRQRFSQSVLWQRQRHYFENRGITAWHHGAVPHYITNNPFIANAYARIVAAWVSDWAGTAVSARDLDPRHPLYLIELGAGCRRFAFLILKQLQEIGGGLSLCGLRLKYVMTDFTEGMLDFWGCHPWLAPFVADGSLDFAVVEGECDHPITLRRSGETLTPEGLANPLVVLANYYFDSIPQDVFTLREGKLYEVRVSLGSPDGESAPGAAGVLGGLDLAYEENPTTSDAYEREDWNQVLRAYEGRHADASFAFPTVALQCLDRFRKLSRDRLLVVAADQGYCDEDSLPRAGPPILMDHGSFSMYVNYHALGLFCLNHGGHVLHPARPGRWLNVSAFLFGRAAGDCRETVRAYGEAVNRFGPDDFFTLKKGVEKAYESLDLAQLLAYLRSSRWDPNILLGCTPVLQELLADASAAERREMRTAVEHVWSHFYPIGETADLPFSLGLLLYAMGDYGEALRYYEESRGLYGTEVVTLHNMALCHYRLGRYDLALRALEDLRRMAPNFGRAEALRRILHEACEAGRPA
jgi:tetratricopeptide (TPR) repeat protein